MRTILTSLLICAVLLAGYNELVQRRLRAMHTSSAGSQYEQNLMRAQSFVYTRWQPKVVIAGSSISARLVRHPAEWFNLSFAGGSAFTALEILLRSEKTPDLVLIETNVLTIPEDEKLLSSLFYPGMVEARRRWPALREAYKPSHVLVAALPEGDSETTALSGDRLREQIARRTRELAAPLAPAELDSIAARLRRYVRALQERGTRVAFFEAPEYPGSMPSPQKTSLRQRLREEFPPDRYAWVPPVDASDYATTDAVHLEPASADRYARVMARFVSNLDGVAATRPAQSAAEDAVVKLTGD
jgi:hypothetical protein